MKRSFILAPMSPSIAILTVVLWFIPILFGVLAVLTGPWVLGATALFMVAIYMLVWLWYRPTQFTIAEDAIEITFPIRQRSIPTGNITAIRAIDLKEFRDEVGWAVRVGAGGLWGGFGWLWTQRRGLVEFYISRLDGFVYIDRTDGKPLLISPVNPQLFVDLARKTYLSPPLS